MLAGGSAPQHIICNKCSRRATALRSLPCFQRIERNSHLGLLLQVAMLGIYMQCTCLLEQASPPVLTASMTSPHQQCTLISKLNPCAYGPISMQCCNKTSLCLPQVTGERPKAMPSSLCYNAETKPFSAVKTNTALTLAVVHWTVDCFLTSLLFAYSGDTGR
jgi:hypothetical protein